MKILFLSPRFPLPVTKGDQRRAVYMIEALREEHEVTLLSYRTQDTRPKHIAQLEELCRVKTLPFNPTLQTLSLSKALLADTPFQVQLYTSAAMSRLVARESAEADVIHLNTIRMAGNLPKNSTVPIAVDFVDALSQNYERFIPYSNPVIRPLLHIESRRLKKLEARLAAKATLTLIISEPDSQAIAANPRIIRGAVDVQKFHPPLTPEKRVGVVLSGNMSYTPNVDAAEYIVRDIMPRVWKEQPECAVRLVGASPSAKVKRLHGGQVTVTGFVDNLCTELQQAAVAVAPMRTGGGLQNKVLEAMACATPVVASPLANAGAGAEPGKEILIGADAAEIAAHILSILNDPTLAERIGAGGRALLDREFSQEVVRTSILDAYRTLG